MVLLCSALSMSLRKARKRLVDLRPLWVSVLGILFSVRLLQRALVTAGISDLVLAVQVVVGVRQGEWRRWKELRQDPLSRWILGFAASVVMGFVIGRLRLGHLIWWALVNRGWGLLILLGIYCVFASAPKRHAWFYLQCLVVSGSLLNLAALAAAVLRYTLDRGSVFFFSYTSLRLSGLMHNPNAYGGYLAVLLSVQLVAVAFGKSIFQRFWMDAANIVALLLGSLFTISRGSWLALLAAALVIPLIARAAKCTFRQRIRWLAPAGVAICLCGFLLIARLGGLYPALEHGLPTHATQDASWIYFPHSAPFFSEFLRIASDPSGAGDRLAIMRTALQLYGTSASTLAFGLGLGGYAELAPSTRLQSSAIIHNSFLWALVELGPLGAICLLGVFQSVLRRLWRSLRADPEASTVPAALFVAFTSVLVWCLSNDGVYQRHLWFLLGLAVTAAAPVEANLAPTEPAAETLAGVPSAGVSGTNPGHPDQE